MILIKFAGNIETINFQQSGYNRMFISTTVVQS